MKRILVVEDQELNMDLLVQLLEEDYEVLTASDGAAGLSLAEREQRRGKNCDECLGHFTLSTTSELDPGTCLRTRVCIRGECSAPCPCGRRLP